MLAVVCSYEVDGGELEAVGIGDRAALLCDLRGQLLDRMRLPAAGPTPVHLAYRSLLAVDPDGEDVADDGHAQVVSLGDEPLEEVRLRAEIGEVIFLGEIETRREEQPLALTQVETPLAE